MVAAKSYIQMPVLDRFESIRILAEFTGIDKSKKVLDVGCGDGEIACYLAKNYGCKVVGVDINESIIRKARKKVREESLENLIELKVGSAYNLPFPDKTFDMFYTMYTYGHINNKREALKESVRVTKRYGYGVFLEPLRSSESENHLSDCEWEKLCEECGLEEMDLFRFSPHLLIEKKYMIYIGRKLR